VWVLFLNFTIWLAGHCFAAALYQRQPAFSLTGHWLAAGYVGGVLKWALRSCFVYANEKSRKHCES